MYKTAAEWFSPMGSMPTPSLLTDESAIDGVGKFGPEAPDMEQSPVIYHIDCSPTPQWRSKIKEQCVNNTFINDSIYEDRECVAFASRGEVAFTCPTAQNRGSRYKGQPDPSVSTYLNNLKLSLDVIYAGLIGNPSRASGHKNVGQARMGANQGTSQYSGGSLTSYMNGPISAFAGQGLYMLTEATVARRKNGDVLGNKYKYLGYKRIGEHQPKLLCTVLPLSLDCVENLQQQTYHHLKLEGIQHYLKPKNISTSNSLTGYYQELQKRCIQFHFNWIHEIEDWLIPSLVRYGLDRAWMYYKSCTDPLKKPHYERAYKTLYFQLGKALQEYYKRQMRAAMARYSDLGQSKSAAMVYEKSCPINLDPNAYNNLDSSNDVDELEGTAFLVNQMLERAQHVIWSAHNALTKKLNACFMGTCVSPIANTGYSVKFIGKV